MQVAVQAQLESGRVRLKVSRAGRRAAPAAGRYECANCAGQGLPLAHLPGQVRAGVITTFGLAESVQRRSCRRSKPGGALWATGACNLAKYHCGVHRQGLFSAQKWRSLERVMSPPLQPPPPPPRCQLPPDRRLLCLVQHPPALLVGGVCGDQWAPQVVAAARAAQ